MPIDLLWPLGAMLLGMVLAHFPATRISGRILLAVGLVGAIYLGHQHLKDPSAFQASSRGLARDQVAALDWVRQQMVPGEYCLTGLPSEVLPAPLLKAEVAKAFWATGKVDLLGPQTRFLVFDRGKVSARFVAGLNKRWLRFGPTFGELQACEILPIPRVGALSQPPFRSSVTLARGPYRPGQTVTFPIELTNGTFETRRLGWIEVEVDQIKFSRLAGFNPLPAHTGEVVELVLVTPEKPGKYEVVVTMPWTTDGTSFLLARKWIHVQAAGAP